LGIQHCAIRKEAEAGAVEVGLEIAKVHGICGSLWVICYVYHLGLVQFIHVDYPRHDALAGVYAVFQMNTIAIAVCGRFGD
jgi:hypothetical protein